MSCSAPVCWCDAGLATDAVYTSRVWDPARGRKLLVSWFAARCCCCNCCCCMGCGSACRPAGGGVRCGVCGCQLWVIRPQIALGCSIRAADTCRNRCMCAACMHARAEEEVISPNPAEAAAASSTMPEASTVNVPPLAPRSDSDS